jgi:hypothetical protein
VRVVQSKTLKPVCFPANHQPLLSAHDVQPSHLHGIFDKRRQSVQVRFLLLRDHHPLTGRALLAALRVQDNTLGQGGAAFSRDREHAWFIGLAPADQPKYAIAVLLEDAQNASAAEDLGRGVLADLIGAP